MNTQTSLSEYNRKRDFEKTSEPVGKKRKTSSMPIFSVQYHESRRTHYDLRLEYGGVLLSWAIPKGPSYDTKQRRLAVKVEDHPLDYACFEGEIPKGQYGGGKVTLWDVGVYSRNVPFKEGLKKGSLKFTLHGKRLKGSWALVNTDGANWLLIKEKDEFSKNPPAVSDAEMPEKPDTCAEKPLFNSQNPPVVSDTETPEKPDTCAENLHSNSQNPFGKFKFKQAAQSAEIPTGDDWIYEIKYDGYRVAAFVEGGNVKLLSRNGTDLSAKFTAVTDALRAIDGAAIIDGEMTVIKDGKTDFGALGHYAGKGELCYVSFDLLARNGKDLRQLPLEKRKRQLEKLLDGMPKTIAFSQSFEHGEELFSSAKELGLEGIVCKKSGATYAENDWLKVKCRARQEFIICGYTSGKKAVSSLLLGVMSDGKLQYVGSVGTGIGAKDEIQLKEAFKPLETTEKSIQVRKTGVKWLKPTLIAEVEFAEWTSAGKLRQASYKGLRVDKSAGSVVNETHSIAGITITNPQRPVFPQITKIEIARYYEGVAKKMLPYLVGRPITVLRCNGGIEKSFFKKHPEGDKTALIKIDTEADIIRQVQLGTVEFHITCCAGDTSIMVFDLDPDPTLPLDAVRRGALDLRELLASLTIKSFVKTSGGKGYHVVVPMPPLTHDGFAEFAKSVALLLAEKHPDRYTADMKKSKRVGKIFIDWQRNTEGATAVAPFSLRARRGAPVSAPIPWSKLEIPPDGINIRSRHVYDWQNFFSANR